MSVPRAPAIGTVAADVPARWWCVLGPDPLRRAHAQLWPASFPLRASASERGGGKGGQEVAGGEINTYILFFLI